MQYERNYRYAPCCTGARRGIPTVESGGASCGQCDSDTMGCGGKKENMVLAMAYVPDQIFRALYSPHDAIARGTLFEELDLPYGGAKC